MPKGEPRKRGRLSRSGDFDRVYREGRSHSNRFCVLYAFPRDAPSAEREGPASLSRLAPSAEREGDSESAVRLGISVSRKVGGAVERNSVKRSIREAFWTLADDLPAGYDFVLVARPDVATLVEREGSTGVAAALGELVAETGIDGRNT